MSMERLASVDDVVARIRDAGLEASSLGTTAMGDPLVAARHPGALGASSPEVLITAGAHAGEPAGVYAALDILTSWDDDLPLTVVPLRDPFAFEGMQRCLERVTGERPQLSDHHDLEEFLLAHSQRTVCHEGDFVLVDLGSAVAASLPPSTPPSGPRLIEQRINALLAAEPSLVAELAGRRVFYPSNAGETSEDVGDFDRAFSAEISTQGLVRDMNRRFGQPDAATEVRLVSDLVSAVSPFVSLDLHEGQGSSFYLFVSNYGSDERTTRYADAIMDRLEGQGLRPTTLADVEARLGSGVRQNFTEGRPGVLVERPSDSPPYQFAGFASQFGPSLTVESGRWAPLAQRVAIHREAVHATLQLVHEELGALTDG